MAKSFSLDWSSKKYSKFFENIEKLPSKIGVKYGFLEGKSAKYKDGTPVINVAIWNEFGTERNGKPHIPERPFFRTTWSKRLNVYQKKIHDYYMNLLNGKVSDAEDFFNLLGAQASNELKIEISSGKWTPNAPSTIARKKSDVPLVDTGEMKRSVTWEVTNEVGK